MQVKRIARRYKTQVDEQSKEMEELKKKVTDSGQPSGKGAEAGTAAPPAENADVTAYETKVKELTEQIKNFEEEVKKLKELDEQNKVRYKQFRIYKWLPILVGGKRASTSRAAGKNAGGWVNDVLF